MFNYIDIRFRIKHDTSTILLYDPKLPGYWFYFYYVPPLKDFRFHTNVLTPADFI